MTSDTGVRTGFDPSSLDKTDRILLGVCAVLWLLALGAGVAAIVALSKLGDANGGGDGETPWLLYAVIGVSAVVIIAAVPLLIRARRESLASGDGGSAAGPVAASPVASERPGAAFGDPVASVRPVGSPVIRRSPVPPPASSRVGFPTRAVERIFLRCPVSIAAAMGGATALTGIATYLAATDNDGTAWAAYGLAALVVVAMPAIPVFFLRQLRSVLA